MTVIAAFLAAGVLTAQEDAASITQRIEVTRQYVPELGEAQKLDFPPRMADTVTLKPDISYAITPTPWKSVFDTEPIAPVAISTAEYRHQRPFYLMLGGGYPAQSRLDFYAAFSTPRDIRAGVYANHVGQWAKLENERGTKEPASWTENGVGLYAGRDFGTRSLDFDIRYGYNFCWFMNGVTDALLASQNACLEAEAHGLGICYLGTTLYNAGEIARILRLPKGVLPVMTVAMGYPETLPPLTDRLPLDAVVHRDTYTDYTPERLEILWREREASAETQQLLAENRLPNLARIFTERRYVREDNVTFSRKYFDELVEQGFFNQQ